MGTYLYRLLGACALDSGTYEGIEADRRPIVMVQAVATVVLSSLATGLGAMGMFQHRVSAFGFVTGLALVTWFCWAVLMLQIGTRALPEPGTQADMGELLRTTGFAAAPGLLQAFAVLPGATKLVFVGAWIWMVVAMIVAVRQALDFHTTRRAVAVCGVAALLSLLMAFTLAALFAPTAS